MSGTTTTTSICLAFLLQHTCQHSGSWVSPWRSCWALLLDTLVGHSDTLARDSYLTLLSDIFPWHFCVGKSYLTLLKDTFVGHSDLTRFLDTSWHFCGTLLLDASHWTLLQGALTWHSCKTLFLDTLVGHFLHDTLVGNFTWHVCRTVWLDRFSWHFCETLLLDTLVRHSYLTLLTWHPCRTFWPDRLSWHFCIRTS